LAHGVFLQTGMLDSICADHLGFRQAVAAQRLNSARLLSYLWLSLAGSAHGD
jgi:hypothetical protein